MVRVPFRLKAARATAALAALVGLAIVVCCLPVPESFVPGPYQQSLDLPMPSSFHRVQPRTTRCFFGGESEISRLKRENEELKKKLGEEDREKGGSIIERIGNSITNGIKSLFGEKKEEKKDPAPLAEASSFPGALGILGTLLRPAFGMLGSLLKDSQDDIQSVLSEAETILTRSGRLGSRVECGPIFSQSYSSMNINGQQSTQVQLQCQAKGDQRSGTVSCSASIGPDGVTFKSLSLDGQAVDTGPSAPGSNVIDV